MSVRECLTWKSLGTTEFYSSQTPWLVFSLFSSELSVFFPFIALLWVRKITEFMSFVFMVLLLQCFLQYRPIPHMAAQTHICTFSSLPTYRFLCTYRLRYLLYFKKSIISGETPWDVSSRLRQLFDCSCGSITTFCSPPMLLKDFDTKL